MKRAKYVQKIRYFEDAPTDSIYEANTVDRLDDSFSLPFQSEAVKRFTATSTNCDSHNSPYACLDSQFCGWDAKLLSCFQQTFRT